MSAPRSITHPDVNLDANHEEGEGSTCHRDHFSMTETTPTGDNNNNNTK